TLTITGGTGNSYLGTTTVNAGTLTVAGSGSISTSTSVVLNLGGTLKLDNTATSVNDRIGDAVQVSMNGGTLLFVGNKSGPTTEVAGVLRLGAGASHVNALAV